MQIEQFRAAAGISRGLAERWFSEITKAMGEFGIELPAHQAAFIAQIGHESGGFTRLSESFNYSVAALQAVFGHRLNAQQCARLGRQRNEAAVPLARQQEIANLVYGSRYGNGPDEGWHYRGRGLKQITFRDNYRQCGAALNIDLLTNPDLLLKDEHAARSAAWYWVSRNCGRYVDMNDFGALTRAINGGHNGLQDRLLRWERAKSVLLKGSTDS